MLMDFRPQYHNISGRITRRLTSIFQYQQCDNSFGVSTVAVTVDERIWMGKMGKFPV
jgi:hypothetical protein